MSKRSGVCVLPVLHTNHAQQQAVPATSTLSSSRSSSSSNNPTVTARAATATAATATAATLGAGDHVNQVCSVDEVEAVAALVEELLDPSKTRLQGVGGGQGRPLTMDDVLVVTPFNMQVGAWSYTCEDEQWAI